MFESRTISILVLGTFILILALAAPSRVAFGKEPTKTSAFPSEETLTTATLTPGLVTLRVDLKSKGKPKKERTEWDGRLTASGATVKKIRSWKNDPRDLIDANSWKLTTRHTTPWNAVQRKRGHLAMPLEDTSLVIELADASDDTRLQFETLQGDFQCTLSDIPLGSKKSFLKGLVQIARMPNTVTMLTAPTEDDYPSAARADDGKLYVAYVAFTHGEDFRSRAALPKPPDSFDDLEQPTGGDQVLLLRLDDKRWSEPMPVTPPGEDVYRTALAIDGKGRVWIFWVAKQHDRWDLFARNLQADRWSDTIRLESKATGPALMPVATTDSTGRVWVAWQAFFGATSQILIASQKEQTFDIPIRLTDDSPLGNRWTPSIAACSDGRIAVAWDTYERGNYDIRARIATDGKFDPPIDIAASPRAEMRSSITFDGNGRLWVAYENGPERWGKDWGAMEKEGSPLYQGRSVAVRILDDGKLFAPADDLVNAFSPWFRTRKPKTPASARLAFPRLTTDAKGRVWMAVRSPKYGSRMSVGTAWFEHVIWYQGDQWSTETVCPQTDNLLDNRPALIPMPTGEVLLIGASDGRYATGANLPGWFVKKLRSDGQTVKQPKIERRWPDRVNNELVLASLGPAPGRPTPAQLVPIEPDTVETSDPLATKERADIQRARELRTVVAGKTLRLVRGEFHRHTEISSDGGGDGSLMDMWRYGLDAASHDWIGNGDHDNGGGRDYSWWTIQKTTDLFHVPGAFSPMYTYERSCSYPDGHRNVVFSQRGVRTLPRLRSGMGTPLDELPVDAKRPNTPDTQMLYRYLARFDGICASHTSGTDMGTDWRDNNAKVEPIVEIYQGCRQNYEMPGAPRSNTSEHSLGGWRPFGFVSLALKKGYRLGFQASSDHVSTHISYCNVWSESLSNDAILAAMKARHLYGATDNILADVRSGEHFMGDEFTTSKKPQLSIHLIGTQPFAKVHIIKDNLYVHSIEPNESEVQFEWTDFDARTGKTSYYYIRGEQTDGELVWVSPLWITYQPD